MFLGSFRLDLIHPYPPSTAERPEFAEYYAKFETFLRNDVDSMRIDATDAPAPVVRRGRSSSGLIPRALLFLPHNRVGHHLRSEA
jgi:hypothetical protein